MFLIILFLQLSHKKGFTRYNYRYDYLQNPAVGQSNREEGHAHMREQMGRVKQRVQNQLGFTLIELMAVLAILALILLIAVPAIGGIIDKAKASADESSIALMEKAGEQAYIDKLPFDADAPEQDSYTIPTLVEKGYLKLEPDSKYNAPENYVMKENKVNNGGTDKGNPGTFIYKGVGSPTDTGSGDPGNVPYVALTCEEAEAQGYTCIYTPEEFNDIRNNLGGKYILMNDIDLAGYPDWSPIGNSATPFSGIFNGNGKNITNVVSTVAYAGSEPYGLFGVVTNGEFKHFTLDVDFTHLKYDGSSMNLFNSAALVGLFTNTVSTNPDDKDFVVDDVHVTGSIFYEGYGSVAGIVADVDHQSGNIQLSNSSFNGTFDGPVGSAPKLYGLMGNVYADRSYGDTLENSITLTNNTVDIVGTTLNDASGAFGEFTNYEGSLKFVIDGLTVNSELTGQSLTGVSMGIYNTYVNSDSIIRNIEVNGSLNGTFNVIGAIYGFWDKGISETESDFDFKYLMDNIVVNADLTGRNISGVFEAINPRYGRAVVDIGNIAINSNMNGRSVSSVMSRFIPFELLTSSFNIHDVSVAGTATLTNGYYAGFIELYQPSSVNYTTNFSNIDIDMAVTGAAYAGGFIGEYMPGGGAENTTVSNVNIAGSISGKKVGGLYGMYGPSGTLEGSALVKDVMVTADLSGTHVAGLIESYSGNRMVYDLVVDNYQFNGSMAASERVGGLFGEMYVTYITDGALNFVVKNSSINADMTSANPNTVVMGGIIGLVYPGSAHDYKSLTVQDTVVNLNHTLAGHVEKAVGAVYSDAYTTGTAQTEDITYTNVMYNGNAVTN